MGRRKGAEIVRYFDDYRIGDRIETAGLTLTEAEIIAFGRNFAPDPAHFDRIVAGAGPGGGLCANWVQVLSVAFRLFIEAGGFADTGEASPGMESARSLLPVRPGDTIRAVAEVVYKRPLRSRPQSGLMINAFEILNQRGERVAVMRLKSFMRRDPARVAAETAEATA